jgi:hypothetical protein
MVRRASTLVVVLAAAALLSATPAASDDEQQFQCVGTMTGVIPGDVIVPPGATCILVNATVLGDVQVRPTGALWTQVNVHVRFNIQADRPLWIGLGFPFGVPPNTVGGDVQVKQTIATPPPAAGAFNFLCNTRVRNVQLEESSPDAPWDIGQWHSCHEFRNFIGGDVQAFKNQSRVRIGQNRIDGDLQFVENTTTALGMHEIVGVPFGSNGPQVLPQEVGGDLQVFKNVGGVLVAGNHVDGNLQCADNAPPATAGPNVVGRSNQCTG